MQQVLDLKISPYTHRRNSSKDKPNRSVKRRTVLKRTYIISCGKSHDPVWSYILVS